MKLRTQIMLSSSLALLTISILLCFGIANSFPVSRRAAVAPQVDYPDDIDSNDSARNDFPDVEGFEGKNMELGAAIMPIILNATQYKEANDCLPMNKTCTVSFKISKIEGKTVILTYNKETNKVSCLSC